MAPQLLSTTRSVGTYRTSEKCWGVFNRTYKANGTRYGVIWIHGSGGNPDTQVSTGNKLQALAAAGYPVICCDLSAAVYQNSNWCNADHLDAIDDAWTFAKSTFGFKTDKVILGGNSMGGCGSLAWARANLSTVLCVGAYVPVLDIDFCYQQVGLRPYIETAYGITYPDPIVSPQSRSPTSFGASDLLDLPVRLWASSNDTVASDVSVCEGWDGAGSDKTVVDIGAVGHDASDADPQEMVQFFDDNGGRE